MLITCDLHIHSALSPCALNDMTPNNIVNMALLEELTAIAITDHNSCENAEAAMKVAMGTGLVVIPGMEVQTREDVHVVTLFPGIEEAKAMQKHIYDTLPPIKAPKKQMEKQLIMDEEDEVIGQCDKLLNMGSSLSVEEVAELALSLGGVAVPAHIDRKSMSLLASLGFVPKSLPVKTLEVSMYADKEEFELQYPNYRIISDTDSHELGLIGMVRNELDVETVSAHGIIKVLNTAIA